MIRLFIVLSSTVLMMPGYSYREKTFYNQRSSEKCDTITSKSLFRNVIKGIECMDSVKNLSTDQAVMLIKTYNTLFIVSIAKNAREECIYDFYKKKFRERFITKDKGNEIGLTIGKRFSTYSSMYDLYVGEGTATRCRDIYIVIN